MQIILKIFVVFKLPLSLHAAKTTACLLGCAKKKKKIEANVVLSDKRLKMTNFL